jgi:hypothetical protein
MYIKCIRMAKKVFKGGGNLSVVNPLYVIITALICYIIFLIYPKKESNFNSCPTSPPININQSVETRQSNLDIFNDPYNPPLRNDFMSYFPGFGGYSGRGIIGNNGYGYRRDLDIRGSIPIPVATQAFGYSRDYSQIGILTRVDEGNSEHPLILPLMGRKSSTNRDRMMYYSMSNTGSVNTKLPIKMKGKSCTSEQECNEIYSGDEVLVQGYNKPFLATIYENNNFQYNDF